MTPARPLVFTRKKVWLIFLALIVSFGSYLLMTKPPYLHLTDETLAASNWTLHYLSFRSEDKVEFKYSLNPRDSDLIQNSILLGGLVGTLVKYGNSGRIEPYMAESFQVEPGNKKWTFKLRHGLTCEDGKEINSERFVNGLTASLKRYAKIGDALDFENLVGWKEFKNHSAKSIEGIKTDGDKNIIFTFSKAPSDLLELLRMPYFGFWCESNFQGSEQTWKDDHKIISSGAYFLDPSGVANTVVLKLRKGSGYDVGSGPSQIIFGTATSSDLNKDFQNTIFEFSKKNDFDEVAKNYQKVVGPPTMLFSIALSPYYDGPFKDKLNRQIFSSRINSVRREFPQFPSQFFYFNAKSKLIAKHFEIKNFKIGKNNKLIFAVSSKAFSQTDLKDVDLLLTRALEGSGLNHEIIIKDAHDNGWVHKVDSNKEFDARVTTVDIGGYVINAAIKMMFCSTMGINFGDPSGRICELVDNQDSIGGPISQKYIDEFNQIVDDDAIVIPLYHYGMEWRLTSDLDAQSLPLVATEPILEKIKRKQ